MSELTDDRLLPCPFCGDAVEIYARQGKDKKPNGYWTIKCPSTEHFVILTRPGKSRAIAAWNRRAAASTSTEGAGVKALEWRREPANLRYEGWQADTAFGTTYQCSHVSDKWQTWRYEDETPLGVFNTADEAKAAAQADFERRVRSCLNPPASKVTTDEAEERG